MALQPRHRWMLQKVADHFSIRSTAVAKLEEGFRQGKAFEVVSSFLGGVGDCLFVSVSFHEAGWDSGASADGPETPSLKTADNMVVTVSNGMTVGLEADAVYFIRARGWARRSLDLTVDNDNALVFGSVSHNLLSGFETVLSKTYRPLFDGRRNWGTSSPEHTAGYLAQFDKFAALLSESLRTLHSALELRKPDDRFDLDSINRRQPSVELMVHFVELLEEWCRQTEAYLDESDSSRFDDLDAGPETELEYWRRRMQRLTSITEQLKTKECTTVITVLSSVSKSNLDYGVDQSTVSSLMRRWKMIDINITEAANEAKDNVKFLATLEKFIDPLYNGTPATIIDTLPALLNSIKMIHTIARYYNTTERMTNLFIKITNQMIANCKKAIFAGPRASGHDPTALRTPSAPTSGSASGASKRRGRRHTNAGGGGGKAPTGRIESENNLWAKEPDRLLANLEACLRLNEAYQDQYRLTKDKLLALPKGKQFDFSENQIFGKFDLFCRRVIKLLDMFSTIHQFKSLAQHHLEGMDELINAFFSITREFRAKGHDLLDFTNSKFDRDYVEFNVRISDLETALQHFINNSFENITSIEASLNLLKKFQTILQRENLKTDLDSKFTLIFHSYGLDLLTVQDLYEKHKHRPPIPRNLPPVAGNVMWARHLLNRIQAPMKKFESNGKVLQLRDSRKIIKTYNKVARTLVAFEYLWYEAWCKSVDAAKAGLQATLIVRHPQTKKLYANFDPEILQLIREAKCLHRMSVDVPESAKLVMLQEDKFKDHYNQLSYLLAEYDRITSKILPVTARVLQPHVRDLDLRVRPGMTTLTWTSMNIDGYVHSVSTALKRLDDLVTKTNDIVDNRIEKNIKLVSKMKLVDLPRDRSLSLDDFVAIEERYVRRQTESMSSKNTEIELAVHDVIHIVSQYELDPHVGGVSEDHLTDLVTHYNGLMYQALLRTTKNSLEALKKRVCSKASLGFLFIERPFFEVDVQLAVPSVRLSPSLADIQRTLNKAALAVLRCSKSVWEWGQTGMPAAAKASFFDRIGLDIEIVKVVLLLTGAFQGTKNQVSEYLATFHQYDWLWKEDMEATYGRFMERDPQIEDFDKELRQFVAVEKEIEMIAPLHNIGALSLNTKNLKLQLRSECRNWKVQYSDKVHQQAKEQMIALFEYMRSTTAKLNREVESIDALRSVMAILKEVREKESSIEMEIMPILDMYQMLEQYLPGGVVDKEEMDQRSVLRTQWTKLVDLAEDLTDRLSEVQGTFKHQLTTDVRGLLQDVASFREAFLRSGPMVPGISPADAVERLNRFNSQFTDLERRRELYTAGEELFALRPTRYPELDRTKRELGLLDSLYQLYLEVVRTMEGYKQMTWSLTVESLGHMTDKVAAFDARCRRLPKKLREWDAYKELRATITDFQEVLPLLQQLSNDSMKQRHWSQVMTVTGSSFDMEGDLFTLSTLLAADLLAVKEEVEDICDSAVKQAQIEAKLTDIKHKWSITEFEFGGWKAREVPILVKYGGIMEELEESQLSLQTMLSMRHVAPFRGDTQGTLSLLSDTADTLELWLKVQIMWTSLESVFTGGDIAKQMPLEAKKFARIDKDFAKLMLKAEDTRFVVPACANELLRNTLPLLFAELEKCQKSLEGYLEQKRGKFPRFYFVSNPVLLQVLSQGSDPLAVQQYYEKIFDSIDRVVHDSGDVKHIAAMISLKGSDKEEIAFVEPVRAEGNIEGWLCVIEKRMQQTVKMLCEAAAGDALELSPSEMVDEHCAQMALLGLQLAWTGDCTAALDRARSSKSAMAECNKKQVSVLAELGTLCLSDLPSKMARTKVETMVTIQVHQRDVFADLVRLFKERKLQDSSDFEWNKQARFYWHEGASDAHGDGKLGVSVCDVDFGYSYEYLGCKERLVITPLTDRAYITLTQALGMNLGGAPAGPAGTGKTETVKDLGRALGLYVVVTNCTDQQRYSDMAKIFKGLCQAGLWGCFDEFNRIELPVLSVVAQQVLAITNARRTSSAMFSFPGDAAEINLTPSVGYFITMNPGYQGRQELPENLKALFRGVAMMVPDREIIMKVKLCSVGYTAFSELAKKFRTLYKLCEEQLSKQKHYDFGLRNILSVLRTAGKTKRDNMEADEEMLLMRTLRDMNLSKLVAQDTPLFLSLLKDLFPAVGNPPGREFPDLTRAITSRVAHHKLVAHPQWVNKIMQLYETTLVRHGIMLVGPGGAGKSCIFKVLMESLAIVESRQYKMTHMNPKAIRAEEMFGETEKHSGEWLPGVFGAMWEKFNKRDAPFHMWMVCDGPVDAIWIENLNTVLDDNKILTLANGDRLPMTDNVKLMFEVQNLRNASPATVSRAGIIFVSETDLDWQPVVDAWLQRQGPVHRRVLQRCFARYVKGEKEVGALSPERFGILFHFLQRRCHPVIKCSRIGIVTACLNLLTRVLDMTGLATLSEAELRQGGGAGGEDSGAGEDAAGGGSVAAELERCFVFCLAWAAGGLLEDRDRVQFDAWLRGLGASMPELDEGGGEDGQPDSVFNYVVDQYSQQWKRWELPDWEVPEAINLPPSHMAADGVEGCFDTSALLVPTIDSTRAVYLLQALHHMKLPVMMTGGSGTAKTSTAMVFFEQLRSGEAAGADDKGCLIKTVNFSSATTAGMFQSTVEGELDRRGGKSYGPPGGKRLTVFLDDLNMPELNEWGDQPTLELVRQLVETDGFAFLDKDKRGELKHVEDLQYVGAMSHPGGGKNDIPQRLKRHFFIFNMTVPAQRSIDDIYGRLLRARFAGSGSGGPVEVPRSVVRLAEKLLPASIALWNWCKKSMLPTPAKFHYIFNLRDLGRVFQGVMRCPIDVFTGAGGGGAGAAGKISPGDRALVQLWRHECDRVFGDRLATEEDKAKYVAAAREVTAAHFGERHVAATEVMFVDYLHMDDVDEDELPLEPPRKRYEVGGTIHELRGAVLAKLGQHNEEHPAFAMNLVLFDDAMRHLLRISRLLGMPRGNALLVGVGGSGKRSLTRLASFLAGHVIFSITMTKNYGLNSLLDDLRALYKKCGTEGVSHTFMVTDADIKDETFLEYFNSVLMTGEVTNLFPKDEMTIIAAELLPIALKQQPGFQESHDNLMRFFYDRVRANLHLVLCMSPVNPKFPERARKFPGLIGGCTIDWFLPWPEEALVSVSRGLIQDFPIECDADVKQRLMEHMGVVHKLVSDACGRYLQQMRRHVYQTPKSFLSFLAFFKQLYARKVAEITEKEARVKIGLEKLAQGAQDVEAMKVVLAKEEVKLKQADTACTSMLGTLEISSLEAKTEKEAVNKIRVACEADAARIAAEKKLAEEDLAKAQPFLDEANAAIDSITAPDLTELKGLGKPSDIIKMVFDCVCILRMAPLVRVTKAEMILGIGKAKRAQEFIADSYAIAKKGLLADINFLKSLLYFSEYEKDMMNEETIELLAPYMEVEEFIPAVARNASKAAEGLCTWVRAMAQYHAASKVVKPKLEALNLAEARLAAAERELQKASDKLNKCKAVLDKLQSEFETLMADKTRIEDNAAATRSKMTQATQLIGGLSGERKRWTSDCAEFADLKRRLPGDCALACAFVSYAGPFNQEYRQLLSQKLFPADLEQRQVPVTTNLRLAEFLVDRVTVGDWNSEGLPTDPLSTQNGIMVTRSSRYPLLIDPQGQGLKWIIERENRRRAAAGRVDRIKPLSLQHPRLAQLLEVALGEGDAMIIAGVEQELDPMLDPVLEKQIVVRNKSKYITIGDRNCEYNDNFMLYITTRLPNPHFSPELQATTTVVDFAVTQKGLEEQLLGRVIQKEQKSLEEQLTEVLEEVNAMTKDMVMLDAMLLERLSANEGNLLEDTALIGVLADTKAKAMEVNAKLVAADETRTSINEKREQYRPVATRGSVLYFAIVDMTLVNCMYQTSLDQFLALFMASMDKAEKASLASKRIQKIIAMMTRLVVNYIARGLYEKDKMSYKLICLLKILTTAGSIDRSAIKAFLKGGAALDIATARPKSLPWLPDAAWLNVLALGEECTFFSSLPESLLSKEAQWRRWYEENEPEKLPVVDYDTRLKDMGAAGTFYRLLIIRTLREDRTLLAVSDFIRSTEWVVPQGSQGAANEQLPGMGPDFVAPATTTLDSIYAEMNAVTPVIYLLSAGADPTDAIEVLARKQKQQVECVSMGEGQDVVAARALGNAATAGSWVLLQNCHLGLPFMERLEVLLKKQAESQSPEFRLFITAEPHPAFPISLLQMCTKVTNEPPAGLRAGLLRSYTAIVDQGQLERVDTMTWRQLVFVICFLHSIVQERRKFGPLGWCIPYEFNNSDLQASLLFLEKHLYQGSVSWQTVQYMVSEVQYGGKITDDMDRRLFNAFSETWVAPPSLQPSFSFNPDTPINRLPGDFVYSIPDGTEIEVYRNLVAAYPEVDSPELFGLHPNADLTFRVKETNALLATILDTQPKESAAAGGKTREDVVDDKAVELLDKLPAQYNQDDVQTRIGEMGGLGAPLNIFLFQEVQRLTDVIANVLATLTSLRQAIHGEVAMTPVLSATLTAIFNARVPQHWVFTVGGDELSWLSSSLGVWYAGLLQRDAQLRSWLADGRPVVYWLTGFFNPQGFLTAMRQEVTRQHEKDRWALDDVVFHTEVLDFERAEQVRNPPREGVFLHGLFLDGAAWSRVDGTLIESEPKRLFAPLPVLYVTAVTKAQQKVKQGDLGSFGGYECPCYKYPARTDRYLIFMVVLPSREHKPTHWVLRGVALLCSTE